MEGLMKLIEDNRAQFSKGQKRIADYIVNSYDEAAFMTAAKLGETVGVSESTVVRFAYSIGLDGYPALQEALQELIRHRLTSVQRIRLAASIPQDELLRTVLTSDMNNIRATIDMIDNASFRGAIEAILKARRIYVLGIRSAMSLAQFLTYYLDFVCDNRSGIFKGDAFDIIYGPVANDDVYTTFTLSSAGVLNKAQTLEALKIKKLYNQLVLSSEKALRCLTFLGTVPEEEL